MFFLLFVPALAAGVSVALANYLGPSCDVFPAYRLGQFLLYPLGLVLAPILWFPVRAIAAHHYLAAGLTALPALSIAAFLALHLREHSASQFSRPTTAVLRQVAAVPIYVLGVIGVLLVLALAESACPQLRRPPPNSRVNASVRPVTPLAVASVAPVRPARYAVRWAD
jgi:hypothetical protein